jgi:enoyl-CoA hydratase
VVAPADGTLPRALELAGVIAQMPRAAVEAAKAAVVAAEQLPLREGLRRERDLFEALFETEDQVEGMTAFLEKRPPTWRHR